MSAARVVVVGAGLAGLVAAHRLRCSSFDTVVCEASSRIGGRLREDTLDGVSFEPALHALPRSAPALGGLIAELGLSKSVRRAPLERALRLRNGALVPTSMRSNDHLGPGPLRGLRSRRLRNLVEWLGEDVDPLCPHRDTRLDDRSVTDFSRLYLGRRVGPELYEPLLETHFGHEARETSRQLLFTLFDPWGDVEISLAFGLRALPPALATGLEVRTGERVESVLSGGSGVRLGSGEEIRADAVVLAVPATSAAGLVPELTPTESEVFESARYLDVVHLAVSCEHLESTAAIWIPAAEGGPLSGSIDLPSGSPARHLLLLVARPTTAMTDLHRSDQELTETLLEAAVRIHTELRDRLRASKLLRLPDMLPIFSPGRYRAVQRLQRELLLCPERRIFFCGDYMVGPHAEAAIVSGSRAAAQAGARLTA